MSRFCSMVIIVLIMRSNFLWPSGCLCMHNYEGQIHVYNLIYNKFSSLSLLFSYFIFVLMYNTVYLNHLYFYMCFFNIKTRFFSQSKICILFYRLWSGNTYRIYKVTSCYYINLFFSVNHLRDNFPMIMVKYFHTV